LKSDIDRLMREYNLDAIVVLSDEAHNPYNDYLTNRSRAGGVIFKKRDQTAVLIVNAMEIDNAMKSGLEVYTTYRFGEAELRQKHGQDAFRIECDLYRNYFEKLDIKGRVAFYGVADVGHFFALIFALRHTTPGVEFVLTNEADRLFSRAYETKDHWEIAAIKDVARRTSQVVRNTWEFISSHHAAKNEIGSPVLNENGEPLTIGAVKRFIRQQEIELELDDPEGCIFAQGRDGAFPHSVGEDNDVLQVGRAIVFDIFPRGLKSGYFHDMTRTWCIGQAPADVQAAYDDVMAIFGRVHEALKVGEAGRTYQEMTLDYFEENEHPTQRSHPGTQDGYVHSLGHGIGFNIHEAPTFRMFEPPSYLAPGTVFAIEPGLYYPDLAFGVRVEDTVYFDEQGQLHTLTDFPHDLVLPLRGKP
jgi:Xaa-Pro aminopeptidase